MKKKKIKYKKKKYTLQLTNQRLRVTTTELTWIISD